MTDNTNGKTYRKYNDQEIKDIKDDIKELRKSYGVLNDHSGKMATDVEWLKKFFWIVATSSIGALVASVINIINNN